MPVSDSAAQRDTALSPVVVTPLRHLVAIGIEGTDARKFMQGQLTCDVRKLSPEQALYGACTTGQARVQAVVSLLERGTGLIMLVPTALAEGLITRFRASTFNSKVSFELLPLALGIPHALALGSLPPERAGAYRSLGSTSLLRWWDGARLVLIGPAEELALTPDDGRAEHAFRLADVRAGLPQVYPATQASFVPQLLNLDLLGGISYDKGCYVGQEVVARARRSGVPRRMFGFEAAGPAPAPGTPIVAGEREVGFVVDAAQEGAEAAFVLAAIDLAAGELPLGLLPGAAACLTPSSLPYAVPSERK